MWFYQINLFITIYFRGDPLIMQDSYCTYTYYLPHDKSKKYSEATYRMQHFIN